MTSAWSSSWGVSWGSSWGAIVSADIDGYYLITRIVNSFDDGRIESSGIDSRLVESIDNLRIEPMSVAEYSIQKVYIGDLTDLVYLAPSVLEGATIDSNWSCTQRVVDPNGVEVIASTAVTEKSTDNTEFKVYLTPTQTGAFTTTGDYTWYIQLSNSTLTPPFVKETHLVLRVSDQGIS